VLPGLPLREIIGNQVKILSDPVTVNEQPAVTCHCQSEKARQALTHKPGDLLDLVWIGIFRRKNPIRRTALKRAYFAMRSRPVFFLGNQVFLRCYD